MGLRSCQPSALGARLADLQRGSSLGAPAGGIPPPFSSNNPPRGSESRMSHSNISQPPKQLPARLTKTQTSALTLCATWKSQLQDDCWFCAGSSPWCSMHKTFPKVSFTLRPGNFLLHRVIYCTALCNEMRCLLSLGKNNMCWALYHTLFQLIRGLQNPTEQKLEQMLYTEK